MSDSLTDPKYYNELNPQPWDVAINWGLDFIEGNILKYIARAGKKEDTTAHADLMKALTYALKLQKINMDPDCHWRHRRRTLTKRTHSYMDLARLWKLPSTLVPALTGLAHITSHETGRKNRDEAISLMVTYLEHAAGKELE
jgi:predicted HNH restriction endonuclease